MKNSPLVYHTNQFYESAKSTKTNLIDSARLFRLNVSSFSRTLSKGSWEGSAHIRHRPTLTTIGFEYEHHWLQKETSADYPLEQILQSPLGLLTNKKNCWVSWDIDRRCIFWLKTLMVEDVDKFSEMFVKK